MSTSTPFDSSLFGQSATPQEKIDQAREKAQQKLQNAPSPKEAVNNARSFYKRNKKAVQVATVVGVGLVLHRRSTAKAVNKALQNTVWALPEGMSTEAQRTVSELMQDDHFEIGGELYRVGSKVYNDFGELVLKLGKVAGNPIKDYAMLIISPESELRTFNQ